MGTQLKLDFRTSYLPSPPDYQQVKNYFPWDSHGNPMGFLWEILNPKISTSESNVAREPF